MSKKTNKAISDGNAAMMRLDCDNWMDHQTTRKKTIIASIKKHEWIPW